MSVELDPNTEAMAQRYLGRAALSLVQLNLEPGTEVTYREQWENGLMEIQFRLVPPSVSASQPDADADAEVEAKPQEQAPEPDQQQPAPADTGESESESEKKGESEGEDSGQTTNS